MSQSVFQSNELSLEKWLKLIFSIKYSSIGFNRAIGNLLYFFLQIPFSPPNSVCFFILIHWNSHFLPVMLLLPLECVQLSVAQMVLLCIYTFTTEIVLRVIQNLHASVFWGK